MYRIWIPTLVLISSQAIAEPQTLIFQQGVSGYTGFEDTSIFSESTNSGGATNGVFSGRNNSGNLRRALIRLDLAAIPADSIITSVSLDLSVNNASSTLTPNTYALHQLATNWAAGTVNATAGSGGSGAAPNEGDATWVSNFHNVSTWTTPGGDFDPVASASVVSEGTATITTWSDGGLIADVQAWVDDPSMNFGWIVVGPETTNQRIRRFDSADAATLQPKLTVMFDAPPTVSSIVRADADPTNAASVDFDVTFSEDVMGVDSTDFALTLSGVTGATVTNVAGGLDLYTISVATGTGDGTVGLDLSDDDSITSTVTSLILGGTGVGNGDFTTGEEYTIDKTAPSVTVDLLTTNDSRPPLSGTVSDPAATISVAVDAQTNPATNNGDGTWTLPDDVLDPLATGTYDVAITATDPLSNVGSDATSNELTVNLAVSVDPPGLIEEGQVVHLTGPAGSGYQWKKDGSNVVNNPPRVTGATTQTLLFNTILQTDSGSYTVEYDDGSKAIVETPPFVMFVFPPSSLPVAGAVGIAALTTGLLTAYAIRRWRGESSSRRIR